MLQHKFYENSSLLENWKLIVRFDHLQYYESIMISLIKFRITLLISGREGADRLWKLGAGGAFLGGALFSCQ